MKKNLWLVGLFLSLASTAVSAREKNPPTPLVSGLANPVAAAVGLDGKIYVLERGDDKRTAGVVVIDQGKAAPLVENLKEPASIVAWQKWLYVTDRDKIWRIDLKGKANVFVDAKAFPTPPELLGGIVVDEMGAFYVGDGPKGTIYRIDPRGKVTVVADSKRTSGIKFAEGLAMDGLSHLLVADDQKDPNLWRIRIADGSATLVAKKVLGGDSLTWDHFGRLYYRNSHRQIMGFPNLGQRPVMVAEGFQDPQGLCLDLSGKNLLVVDKKAGSLTAVRAQIPGWEVDDRPLPLQAAVAFPKLKWAGWQGFTDDGKVHPLRPLILTHAGDGSDRVFVGIQQGTIHVFPNDHEATKTDLFLNIQDRVRYFDKENEEGFLGLAFHPKYKSNGEFFVFYTSKKEKMTNVISRFKVSKDDPNQADPDSEEVILKIKRPFWNHDGGTICFGPDGYLYIAVGDGGAANDPFKYGQNLKSLLGKVLRIDIDRKDPGLAYAIPKDNPFVDHKDARPETWAYGLRNIWRMAFDKKTGRLWASDVGQNLYEEIDLIEKGGNYGWSKREGLHPFGNDGLPANNKMIEPIWEYHHDVGKSLTGGHVYRGKRLPELDGAYLYGDFVTAKIWALWYEEGKKRVVANRPIRDPNVPILSFGEDERGEVYFMTNNVSGKGIFHFIKAPQK